MGQAGTGQRVGVRDGTPIRTITITTARVVDSSSIGIEPSFLQSFKCPSRLAVMGSEDTKDPFKGVDWKAVGGEMQKNPGEQPTLKKRLPKKVRQIPDYYFLPRRSLPSAIAFYGSCIAGGVAAGMLLEVWINKKVKEDGGVIWEFDK